MKKGDSSKAIGWKDGVIALYASLLGLNILGMVLYILTGVAFVVIGTYILGLYIINSIYKNKDISMWIMHMVAGVSCIGINEIIKNSVNNPDMQYGIVVITILFVPVLTLEAVFGMILHGKLERFVPVFAICGLAGMVYLFLGAEIKVRSTVPLYTAINKVSLKDSQLEDNDWDTFIDNFGSMKYFYTVIKDNSGNERKIRYKWLTSTDKYRYRIEFEIQTDEAMDSWEYLYTFSTNRAMEEWVKLEN